MVTDSKDGWDIDIVYCGYSDHAGASAAGPLSARPGAHRRDDCRPALLRVQEGPIPRRCDDAVLEHPCPSGIGARGLGGRRHVLLRHEKPRRAAPPCPDGQGGASAVVQSRGQRDAGVPPHGGGYAPRRYSYTAYKGANMVREFSTSIPRTQLRPSYGDGFLGAPRQSRQPLENPAPREQGDQRGSSSPPRQHNSGGAHHLCAEPSEPRLCCTGV